MGWPHLNSCDQAVVTTLSHYLTVHHGQRQLATQDAELRTWLPPRKSCSRSKKKKHRIPAESSASKQTTANPLINSAIMIRPTTGPSEGTLPSSKDEPLCLMPAENPPLQVGLPAATRASHAPSMTLCGQDQEAVIHPAFRVNNCLSDVNDCLSDIAQPEMEEQVSEDPGKCVFLTRYKPVFLGNLTCRIPEGLCRFCDERLPHPQSARLAALGTSLVRRREVARRYSRVNPLALHLPLDDPPAQTDRSQSNSVPGSRQTTAIIPMGIKQGWPTQIDFSKLSKSVPATSIDHPAQKHTNHLSDRRVEKLADHLWAVIHKAVASDFWEPALSKWRTLGRTKCMSIFHEMDSFDTELPGYYGYQGFQLIYQQLVYMFLKSTLETVTRLAHPLDPEYLLRKVLMPEAALCLIGQDMSLPMSHPKVRATLEQSREFGNAMYPDE
ncbi:hypothetical protein PSTT_15201 [Puccinia striiformis]|uniref:Restriction of telomere capping protein 4 n=1 Tax=Puccinia striiformis TaxID=27350 RepID=A0A2S4UJ10_9BASI|nr:hypothetical protein PSTT_15201 [Puccinia striiformis]